MLPHAAHTRACVCRCLERRRVTFLRTPCGGLSPPPVLGLREEASTRRGCAAASPCPSLPSRATHLLSLIWGVWLTAPASRLTGHHFGCAVSPGDSKVPPGAEFCPLLHGAGGYCVVVARGSRVFAHELVLCGARVWLGMSGDPNAHMWA